MAGQRGPELGVRSPLKLRGGIDFKQWEGVNRENDPGAIRDTQFQTAINVRINDNEVVSRGGQTATFDSGVDGCIYGMIDVAGDLGITVWDPFGNSFQTSSPVDPGLFSYGITTGDYTRSIVSTSQLDMTSEPRRNVVPFQGKMLTFAQDPVTLITGLWALSEDDAGNTKWTIEIELPDFNSFAVRGELTTNGANQALYIGTKASNTVYRWDGLTLTTEATAIGSGALIMFLYGGEIYAASTNSLLARGPSADYTTSYAMPGGVTTFAPITGVEYQNVALISGTDTMVGDRQKVLEFDGTTVTVNPATPDVQATFTDLAVANGYVWRSWVSGSNNTVLSQWDGLAWTDVVTGSVDGQPFTGAVFPLGSDIYWWTSDTTLSTSDVVLLRLPGGDGASVEVVHLGFENSGNGAPCPTDMNILS